MTARCPFDHDAIIPQPQAAPAPPESVAPTPLRKTRWASTAGRRRGVIFFCHGFGLYAAKFEELYVMLNAMGYDVVAHDARGHGRWVREELTAYNMRDVADAMARHYREVAHERPILLGVGSFGGFLMCAAMEAAKQDAYQPPSIFYSVEYVPVPSWVLARLTNPRLLRWLDRFEVGYDYALLTHDASASCAYIDDDPLARATFPLGASIVAGGTANRFYTTARPGRHAVIVGGDDRISYMQAVRRRCVERHPGYRFFEVAGGAFHLHWDQPAVRHRFREQLQGAIDHVAGQAEAAA